MNLILLEEFSRVHEYTIMKIPNSWCKCSNTHCVLKNCLTITTWLHVPFKFKAYSRKRKERENFTKGILRNCSGPGNNILQFQTFSCKEFQEQRNPLCLTQTYNGRLLCTPPSFLKIFTTNHLVKMKWSTYWSLWWRLILQTANTLHTLHSW